MLSRKELIAKYENSEDYLAVTYKVKIVIYELDFEQNYVFGATITRKGDKSFFFRQLEFDEHGYVYFYLYNYRHYRKDLEYLRTPPVTPEGYEGKVKDK
jgi:hypothetical protein